MYRALIWKQVAQVPTLLGVWNLSHIIMVFNKLDAQAANWTMPSAAKRPGLFVQFLGAAFSSKYAWQQRLQRKCKPGEVSPLPGKAVEGCRGCSDAGGFFNKAVLRVRG